MRLRATGSVRAWVSARGVIARSVAAVVLAAALVLVVRDPLGPTAAHSQSATTPTSASIEATWGVRFTQIGMSADGGMVDVRYVVLDVDRAAALAASMQATPMLIDEKSKRVIYSVAMKAHAAHDLQAGGRYYLLYRNTKGLLKAGSHVTITVAGERLEHLTVLGTTRT